MASPEQQRATERRRYAIAIVLALLAWYLRGAPFYSAPRHARPRAWLGRSPPVPLEMDVISVAPLALPRLTRDGALRAELNLTMRLYNAHFLPVRMRRARFTNLARAAPLVPRALGGGGGDDAGALYEAGFTELGAFTMGPFGEARVSSRYVLELTAPMARATVWDALSKRALVASMEGVLELWPTGRLRASCEISPVSLVPPPLLLPVRITNNCRFSVL